MFNQLHEITTRPAGFSHYTADALRTRTSSPKLTRTILNGSLRKLRDNIRAGMRTRVSAVTSRASPRLSGAMFSCTSVRVANHHVRKPTIPLA